MAKVGVHNRTARQFNIRAVCAKTNRKVTVRIAPGFNVVDGEHWKVCAADAYVKELKKTNQIDFGSKVDDEILEKDADTKSKSKSEQLPGNAKGDKDGDKDGDK